VREECTLRRGAGQLTGFPLVPPAKLSSDPLFFNLFISFFYLENLYHRLKNFRAIFTRLKNFPQKAIIDFVMFKNLFDRISSFFIRYAWLPGNGGLVISRKKGV